LNKVTSLRLMQSLETTLYHTNNTPCNMRIQDRNEERACESSLTKTPL